MPAFQLGTTKQYVPPFSAIGQYAGESSLAVKHLGISNAAAQLAFGDAVHVFQMTPPLETSEKIEAHVVGHAELTIDEIKKIEVWIQETADEVERPECRIKQYIALPRSEWVVNQNNGVRQYRRFSCSG